MLQALRSLAFGHYSKQALAFNLTLISYAAPGKGFADRRRACEDILQRW